MTTWHLLSNFDVATKVKDFQDYTSRTWPDIKMYATDGFYYELHKVSTF